jgi:GNAT superfamily N-acetyltransferase
MDIELDILGVDKCDQDLLERFECYDLNGDVDSETFYNYLNDSRTRTEHIEGKSYTFVLVNGLDNDVVGFYSFVIKRCKPTMDMPDIFRKFGENDFRIFVKYIAVSEKYRGLGFMRVVINSINDYAVEIGDDIKYIQLQAIPSALSRYVHYGFIDYTEEDLDDDDKEDGLQMCVIRIAD